MFRKLFGKYDALQTSRPVLVKCITAGLLAGTADFIAQAASDDGAESLEGKGSAAKRFNAKRALAFSLFGMSWAGCFNHYWFNFLARRIPGNSLIDVCKKTCIQHGFLNPCVYVPTFLISQPFLLSAGTGCNNFSRISKENFQKDYISTLKTCYTFWIPLSVIQFFAVPTPYHVLYNSGLGFVWNVVLSMLYYNGVPGSKISLGN